MQIAVKTMYIWLLNNMGFNCKGPLKHGIFFYKYSTIWFTIGWIHGCDTTDTKGQLQDLSIWGFWYLWQDLQLIPPLTLSDRCMWTFDYVRVSTPNTPRVNFKCYVNGCWHVANSGSAFWNFLEFFSQIFSIHGWLNPQVQNWWIWRADFLSLILHTYGIL